MQHTERRISGNIRLKNEDRHGGAIRQHRVQIDTQTRNQSSIHFPAYVISSPFWCCCCSSSSSSAPALGERAAAGGEEDLRVGGACHSKWGELNGGNIVLSTFRLCGSQKERKWGEADSHWVVNSNSSILNFR